MIEQLKTIRHHLEPLKNNSGVRKAVDALTQLEAMVGEPWLDERGYTLTTQLHTAAPAAQQPQADSIPVAAFDRLMALCESQAQRIIELEDKQPQAEPRKADVARTCPFCNEEWVEQPQARPDFTDEWAGYLKDGETPFERFLRERKDMQSVLKLYQRVLEENERLKAQQPQAGVVRWRPDVCPITGKPFFMWIDHPEHGSVPTYGGPYDSYTIPVCHEDGSFCCERYDHDYGWWVTDEVHDVGVQIVSDQAYVSDEAPQQTEAVTKKDLMFSTVAMQTRHDERIERIVNSLEQVKQEQAERYQPVREAFWWRVRIGAGTQTIGRCYTETEAQRLAAELQRAFNDGAFCVEKVVCNGDLIGAAAPQQAETVPSDVVRDAERLDYLQRRGATVELLPGTDGFYPMRFRVGGLNAAVSENIRGAIDAAMAQGEKP